MIANTFLDQETKAKTLPASLGEMTILKCPKQNQMATSFYDNVQEQNIKGGIAYGP
jgi:hypothetical protein